MPPPAKRKSIPVKSEHITRDEFEAYQAEVNERLDGIDSRYEKHTPGLKKKPMVAPNQPGVCGLDPDMADSKKCEDASTYRYQTGCKGSACVKIKRQSARQYR